MDILRIQNTTCIKWQASRQRHLSRFVLETLNWVFRDACSTEIWQGKLGTVSYIQYARAGCPNSPTGIQSTEYGADTASVEGLRSLYEHDLNTTANSVFVRMCGVISTCRIF